MRRLITIFLLAVVAVGVVNVERVPAQEAAGEKKSAGNPVIEGWYADPEGVIFGDRYWIYPTYSAPYDQQTFFDAFSSTDLVNWAKHPRILSKDDVTWARRAMWAPAAIEKGGKYYLFFSANDIQNDRQLGGIGVAVADRPEGPFKDHLGKPLIDKFHNGAQPIDQFVFRDKDGTHYMFYGGWRHCNVVKLNEDFTGLVAFSDGTTFKEVTPRGYVEGPFMFLMDGKYYFMWSEGGWTGPNYSVAYAIADSPLGPFERIGKVLEQDVKVATGAGHHSVLRVPPARDGDKEQWFIVYHRRPLGRRGANERVTCIDRMDFDDQGKIKPVKITFEGVGKRELGKAVIERR
jgi:beta-xylosidase